MKKKIIQKDDEKSSVEQKHFPKHGKQELSVIVTVPTFF